MKTQFDVPFSCPPDIAPYLQKVFDGEYDIPLFFYGPHILDLGANCGSFALWASHRFPACTIDAYEPHPKTFEILKRNVEPYKNITIHNFGVGTPGLRVLCNGKNNSGEASFHLPADNLAPTGQHLDVHDPMELPEADMIKLDIEGCEMEVLEPLITSGRKFNIIMLEWHNHSLRRRVDALLKDYFLIGSNVHSMAGLGVDKYMHKSLLPGVV